jgi:hypothetical protein
MTERIFNALHTQTVIALLIMGMHMYNMYESVEK